MAVTNERGGIAQVYLGGQLVNLGATLNIMPGGPIREVATGLSGVAGYTTKIEAPTVEVELFDSADRSTAAIRAIDGGTIQINQNNGKSWVLTGAFQVDTMTLDGAKGTYTAKFAGLSMRELIRSA